MAHSKMEELLIKHLHNENHQNVAKNQTHTTTVLHLTRHNIFLKHAKTIPAHHIGTIKGIRQIWYLPVYARKRDTFILTVVLTKVKTVQEKSAIRRTINGEGTMATFHWRKPTYQCLLVMIQHNRQQS